MAQVQFLRGVYNVHVWRLDNNGIAAGQATDPNTLTADTLYPPYRVEHPVSVTPLTIEGQTVTDYGGTRIRGQAELGPNSLGTVTMTFSDYDMVFESIVSGSAVNSTYVQDAVQGASDVTNPDLPQVAIMMSIGSDSRDDADYGSPGYLQLFFVGTVRPGSPGGNQEAGVNPNPLTYTLTPTVFTKLSNGITFEALGTGYTSNENVYHSIRTPTYQWSFDTYVSNGSATSFNLSFLPIYSDATSGGRNWFVRVPAGATTGNNIDVDSVSTTTSEVDITSVSPLNTGDRIHAFYPTDFEEAN